MDNERSPLDEIAAKQREERRQILADSDMLAALMKSPAWGRYMALVEAVAQNYHATIMKPIDSVLESVKVEFAKGVLSGLSLATSLPQMKLTEAKQLRPQEDEQ